MSGYNLLLLLITCCLVWWLALRVGRFLFRPLGKRDRYRNIGSYEKKPKNGDFADFFTKMRKYRWASFGLDDDTAHEWALGLQRLGRKETPGDLRAAQLTIAGSCLLVALLFYFVYPFFSVVMVIFAVLGWRVPLDQLRKRLRELNTTVTQEFPSFYRQIYYAYKRGTNSNLGNHVEAFIKQASPSFALELRVLQEDIQSLGESEALHRWKRRLPLPNIARFAEIMDDRLDGVDNTQVMYSFLAELDRNREIELQTENNKLKASLDRILAVTYVPFYLILLLYFAAQLLSSGLTEVFK